jgi:hypothetical protein
MATSVYDSYGRTELREQWANRITSRTIPTTS